MRDDRVSGISLAERGAERHFAVGVALMAVLPILTLGYLATMGLLGVEVPALVRVALAAVVVVTGILGFLVLRNYPDSVAKLRVYADRMANGDLPEDVVLAGDEGDITAIEGSMKRIVARLKQRVDALEIERSVLEQRLYQAQRIAGMGVMAGGISRDLGEVLTGIQAEVETLRDGLAAGSDDWNCADEIAQKVEKGWALADLLRLYGSGGSTEMAEFDPAPVLHEIIELLEAYVLEKAELTVALPCGLSSIRGDVTQVQQLTSNLVMNAVEAVGDGKGSVQVSLSVADFAETELVDAQPAEQVRAGRYACLEVSDTGRGMGKEERARIFDPFFSTKPGHRGVGLAVALGIVRSHDGMICVAGEPGKGTTVRVLFPLGEDSV